MAECTACDDPNLFREAICSDQEFRYFILQTLCKLVSLLSTSSSPNTYILPQVTKTAAQLAADYAVFADIGFMASQTKLKKLRIVNTSDADLDFSFNGGTTVAFTVLSGTEFNAEYNLTLAAATKFVMRIASGFTANIGKVMVEGSY